LNNPKKTTSRKLGDFGEKIAADFLIKKGYKILAKNINFRVGEIDLVAEKEKILVFVEIKTRRNFKFGSLIESISKKKLQKTVSAVWEFLQQNNWENREFRIDGIGIFYDYNKNLEINHWKNIAENFSF